MKKAGMIVFSLALILLTPIATMKAAVQGCDYSKIKIENESGASDFVYAGDSRVQGVKQTDPSPIVGYYFLPKKDALPIPNNGGYAVTNKSSEVVEFTQNSTKGYMVYIKANSWMPYIADIKVVNAGTKSAAVEKLIKEHCNYYIDHNYGSDSDCIMVGYQRTDDQNKAITDIIGLGKNDTKNAGNNIGSYKKISDIEIAGCTLYVTNDSKYGNPIRDIDNFKSVEQASISAKTLVDLRLSRGDTIGRQYVIGNDSYKSDLNSSKEYVMNSVVTTDKTDVGIAITSDTDGLKDKAAVRDTLLKNTSEKNDSDDAEEEGAPENATDDDDEKASGSSFDTPSEDANPDEEATADEDKLGDPSSETEGTEGTVISILGENGALAFFIALFGVAILIPIITLIIRKIILKSNKKTEDEE